MVISLHRFFLPDLAEEIVIQNISTKCDRWLNILC